MRRILVQCVVGVVLAAMAHASFAAAPPKTITFKGKDYYINDINVHWNAFGSDVGTHSE
jgi:hypothetical protein